MCCMMFSLNWFCLQIPPKPKSPPENGRKMFFSEKQGTLVGKSSEKKEQLLELWDDLEHDEQQVWDQRAKEAVSAYMVYNKCSLQPMRSSFVVGET